MNKREEVLRKANEMVNGQREEDYGTPENNFNNIADVWSWYLDLELSALDVANMMTLMKMARIKGNSFKADSYIDAIGYLACGYEIASNDDEEMKKYTFCAKDFDGQLKHLAYAPITEITLSTEKVDK